MSEIEAHLSASVREALETEVLSETEDLSEIEALEIEASQVSVSAPEDLEIAVSLASKLAALALTIADLEIADLEIEVLGLDDPVSVQTVSSVADPDFLAVSINR